MTASLWTLPADLCCPPALHTRRFCHASCPQVITRSAALKLSFLVLQSWPLILGKALLKIYQGAVPPSHSMGVVYHLCGWVGTPCTNIQRSSLEHTKQREEENDTVQPDAAPADDTPDSQTAAPAADDSGTQNERPKVSPPWLLALKPMQPTPDSQAAAARALVVWLTHEDITHQDSSACIPEHNSTAYTLSLRSSCVGANEEDASGKDKKNAKKKKPAKKGKSEDAGSEEKTAAPDPLDELVQLTQIDTGYASQAIQIPFALFLVFFHLSSMLLSTCLALFSHTGTYRAHSGSLMTQVHLHMCSA